MFTSLTDQLCAVVAGDREAASVLITCDADAVGRTAWQHGVLPLVADRLASWPDLPGRVADLLRREASRHAAADLVRELELRRLLAAFAERHVDVLVVKGAALAYTHYERPDLRPRADTDLLIPSGALEAANETLEELGYCSPPEVSGDFVKHQSFHAKYAHGVTVHRVDLHWKIANPQLFAGLLPFDELRSAAVPITALAPAARGLSNPHALLLACIHRVAHHYDDDCLIWLFDIHLVASSLSAGDWRTFADLAVDKGVVAISRQGLDKAAHRFGTRVPTGNGLEAWQDARPEATANFLSRDRTQLENLVSNLRTLAWSDRWRLVREHVFPPPEYMRGVYAPSSRAPLAMLYARRAIRGARRWLVRS